MIKAMNLKGSLKSALLLIFALATAFALAGCASDSYDTPDATATDAVLIDADTLQAWRAAGYVNNANSFEKVVILDATDAASYAAGHIPGAQLWDVSEHVMTRVEGPAPAVNMVLDGPSMDAMIQKHGIDENTTIVITSSKAATYFPSRAYFLLRYWGFPKERLKVLNGYNGAWPGALTTEVPTVAASSFSVQDRGTFCPDERAALPELISYVKDGVVTPVDFRGDKSAAGSTGGVFSDVGGDVVVFEGTLKGGKSFVWKQFNVDYDGKDFTFKSAADIEAALNAAGITNDKPIVSYCRTGYIASTGYFVLDAILGWDVMAYDGSWSQWGKMSDLASVGGELPAGSLWATDTFELMDVINYNIDADKVIETLDLDAAAAALTPDPTAAAANNVEIEDSGYLESGADEGSAPAPGAGGGGGC